MIKQMVFIPFHVQTATIEMEVKRLCLSAFVKKSWWDFIYNPYIALTSVRLCSFKKSMPSTEEE